MDSNIYNSTNNNINNNTASTKETIRNLITEGYRKILLREPDPDGLANYIHEIEDGLSIENFYDKLATSDEYIEKFGIGNNKVLIGILVKNTEVYLRNLAQQIINIKYPKEKITIVFLESDSDDNSFNLLKNEIVPMLLRFNYENVILDKKDMGFKLHPQHRHLNNVQTNRLKCLCISRQYIIDRYLSDNDYIFWIDSDYEYIPPKILIKLLSFKVDIIIPCVRLKNGTLYDTGTNKSGKRIDKLGNDKLIEVDSLSAHALISRKVFVSGINYFQEGDTSSIQEGSIISRDAKLKGLKLYVAPKCVIIHHTINGTMPL